MAASKTPLDRYNIDVNCYHKEIEELNKKIKSETDESAVRHLKKMLLETQRALTSVLEKISELEN